MFATGIGLVLKGYEHSLRKQKKPRAKKGMVRAGSKDKLSFLDKIISKGQTFFDDDDV